MKCTIQGCTGEYEDRRIVHTIQRQGEVFALEHVPAQVCPMCGDTLLSPDTIRHVEALLRRQTKPQRMVPLYEYA